MLDNQQYKSYIGQYVKRFYLSFSKEYILKIKGFRINELYQYPEYLCQHEDESEEWYDCEDSCIITNEQPIKDLEYVANVNHKDYAGYNPFTGKLIISNVLN